MEETGERPVQKKDYGGRNPMVIPLPKPPSIPPSHGKHGHAPQAPVTAINLLAVEKDVLYAFHQTAKNVEEHTVTYAHDIHPDITITLKLNKNDSVTLQQLKIKIVDCNSRLKEIAVPQANPDGADVAPAPQAAKPPPKDPPPKNVDYIPIPHLRGDRHHEFGHALKIEERKRELSKTRVEDYYLHPAGFRFHSDHVDMGEGRDGWLYTHKDFPRLEIIIPRDGNDRVPIDDFCARVLETNQQLKKLRDAEKAPPAPPFPLETAKAEPEKPFSFQKTYKVGESSLVLKQSGKEGKIWFSDIPFLYKKYTLPEARAPQKEEFESAALALSEGMFAFRDAMHSLRSRFGAKVRQLPPEGDKGERLAISHPMLKDPFIIDENEPASVDEMDYLQDALGRQIKRRNGSELQALRESLLSRGLGLELKPEENRAVVFSIMPRIEKIAYDIPLIGTDHVLGQTREGVLEAAPNTGPTQSLDLLRQKLAELEALRAGGQQREHRHHHGDPRRAQWTERVKPADVLPRYIHSLPEDPRFADLQKVNLFFDANIFRSLNANRDDDHTLLDIIRFTSIIPTVHRGYTPTIVGDLELRHLVPAEGDFDHMVSIRHALTRDTRERNKYLNGLLANMGRYFVDDTGLEWFEIKDPTHSKLLIMSTSGQMKFYRQLSGGQYEDKLSLMEDAGERACLLSANSLASRYPAIIVSNDHAWLEGEESLKAGSEHTFAGKGIGYVDLQSFLSSLIQATDGKLGEEITSRYGGTNTRFALSDIKHMVRRSGESFPEMEPIAISGKNSDETGVPSLTEFLEAGYKALKQAEIEPPRHNHADRFRGEKEGGGDLPPH